MRKDEINRYIHFGILKNCQGFQLAPYGLSSSGTVQCEHATSIKNPHPPMPDYCSDDSPRRLLNEVVQRVTNSMSAKLFSHQLTKIAETTYVESNAGFRYIAPHQLGVLTAKQIATACVEAHKALNKA